MFPFIVLQYNDYAIKKNQKSFKIIAVSVMKNRCKPT